MEITSQPADGEKTALIGKSLYADNYVREIIDENRALKLKQDLDAETIRKLHQDIEKLQERLSAPVAIAAPPEALKTQVEVFMQEILASDLENLLNTGWEKWHAEFKGSKLYVVMVRRRAADPQPQPQPAVEKVATPPAKVHVPDAIIDPDKKPDTSDEPLEKVVTQARRGAAALYRAEVNARIQIAINAGMDVAEAYTARQRPSLFPSTHLSGKVNQHVGAS